MFYTFYTNWCIIVFFQESLRLSWWNHASEQLGVQHSCHVDKQLLMSSFDSFSIDGWLWTCLKQLFSLRMCNSSCILMFSAANQFVWTAAVNSCLFVKQLQVLLEKLWIAKLYNAGRKTVKVFVVPRHFYRCEISSSGCYLWKKDGENLEDEERDHIIDDV